jgi:amino acid transporter
LSKKESGWQDGDTLVGLRRLVLGPRLASEEVQRTKVNNIVGLSIFSSDALSSVAYATQEILASLSANAGHMGLIAIAGVMIKPTGLSVPVAIGIFLLLVILGASYRQTMSAYPKGGSAYIVAQENLGEMAALIAGASILIDYILTVAVSVSSGIANITSAVAMLKGHEVGLTITAIVLIAIANLRGSKDSGGLFAIPTYGFIFVMALLLGTGAVKTMLGPAPTPEMAETSIQTATAVSQFALIMIFLKAFSSGCTALTGIETISSSVTAFKKPSVHNASKVMLLMMIMLATMFLGITLLSSHFNVVYQHSGDAATISETLLSKLTKAVYGDVSTGISKYIYLATMGFTFLILVVAANSAFVGFPRLAAIMARNRYLPKQLDNQGDRLVFSNGIIALSVASCLLVWLLKANTDLLLPLYAVGVFTGFTLSQTGMVAHWMKQKGWDEHWRSKAMINGLGAIAAAIVWLDIVVNKFKTPHGHGGVWIILLAVPALVYVFLKVHKHYVRIKSLLDKSRAEVIVPHKNRVIVLVSRIHHGTLEALRYAKAIADDGRAEALSIDFPDEHGRPSEHRRALESEWHKYCGNMPLRFIENHYRQIVEPVIGELERMRQAEPDTIFTFVLPEFVTLTFMGNFLHNQTALRLKTMLLPQQNTVVVSVPFRIQKKA